MPHPDTTAAFQTHKSVSTDTRKIQPGDLYFGLKGERFDGNQFAAKALENGASVAVVDDPAVVFDGDARYILVEDSLVELQELARQYRESLNIIVLGLTGSNGKTTTKELLHSVLSISFKAHCTQGNLNNHIGVPLTLLAMPEDTQIAVIEMGANKPGDIAELCEIARPNHALITNIGEAHLELFRDLEGVKKTKGQLFDFIREHGGCAFVNEDDPSVKEVAEGIDNAVTFGATGADYLISAGELQHDGIELRVHSDRWNGGFDYHSKLVGMHNAKNVLAAVTVAQHLGVGIVDIQTGISDYVPKMNRSQLIENGDQRILLDAYNANPTSMRVTLEMVASHQYQNPLLILGDMFELGEKSDDLHQEIVDFALEKMPGCTLLGVGEAMQKACTGKSENVLSFKDVSELSESIASIMEGHPYIMIKGSRGMALENLLEPMGLSAD